MTEEGFFDIVRAGFSSKRKTLLNNLSQFKTKDELKEIFSELNIPEKSRAEDLNLDHWIELTKNIEK